MRIRKAPSDNESLRFDRLIAENNLLISRNIADMNQEIKRQRKTVFYLKDVEKRLPILERKLEYSEQLYIEHNKDKKEFYARRNTI